MKATLDLPLPTEESLKGDFWPTSKFTLSKADQFQEDGTLCKEFAIDVFQVSRRGDCSAKSF